MLHIQCCTVKREKQAELGTMPRTFGSCVRAKSEKCLPFVESFQKEISISSQMPGFFKKMFSILKLQPIDGEILSFTNAHLMKIESLLQPLTTLQP